MRSLRRFNSPRTAGETLVLCYHAVSEEWPAGLSVTPASLEAQLRLLVGRGYVGASFHRAVSDPPAPRTLAVTFDDAYRSVLTIAAPILARLGLVGTVFVPTSFAGSSDPMSWDGIDQWVPGPFAHELIPMSWAELRELADAGWEVGSHTCTHPRLTQLDDDALRLELADSRAECERELDVACPSIAYPYGDHDDRVVRATAAAGYESAAILPTRLNRPEPLRWPRVGIYHADSPREFRLKISPTIRRLRASPLAYPALAARQKLSGRR